MKFRTYVHSIFYINRISFIETIAQIHRIIRIQDSYTLYLMNFVKLVTLHLNLKILSLSLMLSAYIDDSNQLTLGELSILSCLHSISLFFLVLIPSFAITGKFIAQPAVLHPAYRYQISCCLAKQPFPFPSVFTWKKGSFHLMFLLPQNSQLRLRHHLLV